MKSTIGQPLNVYAVKNAQEGKEYGYKTLKGAKKRYDGINGHATTYQETTCKNEYVTIESK